MTYCESAVNILSGPSTIPAIRHWYMHALMTVENQRPQLEKLPKDPAKSVYIPPRPTRDDELMMNAQGSSGTSARAGNCWKWRIPRIQFTRLLRVSSCSLIFMFLATWSDSQTTRRFQVSSATRDPWNYFYRSKILDVTIWRLGLGGKRYKEPWN